MKAPKKELDVDIIGGQGSLTIEEEKALSVFFKKRKINLPKALVNKRSQTIKPNKIKV